MSLYTWCCQGPCKPSSCATFTLNSHWGRVTQAKKKSCIYVSRVISVVSNSLRLCRLWSTRGLDHGGWFSRQEYWSILAILVAMPFFSSVQYLGRVQLIANSWTAAYQGPPSVGFSRQEYWSGVPRPHSTGSQRLRHNRSNPAPIDARHFCLWQLCPSES